jgi:hypothetical protein
MANPHLDAEVERVVADLSKPHVGKQGRLPGAPGIFCLWARSDEAFVDLQLSDDTGEEPRQHPLYLGRAEYSILESIEPPNRIGSEPDPVQLELCPRRATARSGVSNALPGGGQPDPLARWGLPAE